jgi:hypothetical protein
MEGSYGYRSEHRQKTMRLCVSNERWSIVFYACRVAGDVGIYWCNTNMEVLNMGYEYAANIRKLKKKKDFELMVFIQLSDMSCQQ